MVGSLTHFYLTNPRKKQKTKRQPDNEPTIKEQNDTHIPLSKVKGKIQSPSDEQNCPNRDLAEFSSVLKSPSKKPPSVPP